MASGEGTTTHAPSAEPGSVADAPATLAVRLLDVRKTYGDVVAVERLRS
jgi:hypothetical protein